MAGAKKDPWITAGYQMVAHQGFAQISIESISRAIEKNKSSFYHYFGDLEGFESELLEYHMERAREFGGDIQQCQSIRPDMINVFLDYKTDLFFHKQLRINRSNPQYQRYIDKVFELYEQAILEQWSDFLGLEKDKRLAKTLLNLMAENFLLQITDETYHYEWLDNYLEGVAGLLKQMQSNPGDS